MTEDRLTFIYVLFKLYSIFLHPFHQFQIIQHTRCENCLNSSKYVCLVETALCSFLDCQSSFCSIKWFDLRQTLIECNEVRKSNVTSAKNWHFALEVGCCLCTRKKQKLDVVKSGQLKQNQIKSNSIGEKLHSILNQINICIPVNNCSRTIDEALF